MAVNVPPDNDLQTFQLPAMFQLLQRTGVLERGTASIFWFTGCKSERLDMNEGHVMFSTIPLSELFPFTAM